MKRDEFVKQILLPINYHKKNDTRNICGRKKSTYQGFLERNYEITIGNIMRILMEVQGEKIVPRYQGLTIFPKLLYGR